MGARLPLSCNPRVVTNSDRSLQISERRQTTVFILNRVHAHAGFTAGNRQTDQDLPGEKGENYSHVLILAI